MAETKLNIGTSVISISICLLIIFVFFNISVTHTDKTVHKTKTEINTIFHKLDSLENVINISFKNKKDTIIINISNPPIKIYNIKNN